MSDAPPPRPVSHRGSPSYAVLARRLMPPLAAVAAVVVVVVLLLYLNSKPTHDGGGPGPAVVATAPASSATSTTATARTTAPSSGSSDRAAGGATSAAPPPVAEPSATQTAIAKAAVTVLNNSRITGLAHRAAAQVERGGWPIAEIGNFTGRIPESTVYYGAGQRAVAEAFARQFHAVRRVLPRFVGLPGSGLTLVVTRDWPT